MADPPLRRPPTASEARALGHPTRLRIVFACRERARTNKELAELLGTNPGTIHYHLRPLVEEGFVRAEATRPGPRGSREQPYRSTGKSWEIASGPDGVTVLREVIANELLAATDETTLSLSRVGATLTNDDLAELQRRLEDLLEDFRARTREGGAADDGISVTLLVSLHRNPAD
jgi:predicted ArsR family transcriptional regulator